MTRYDAIPLANLLRDHIREERIARLTVSSSSMSPLLNMGDVIGLRQIDIFQIQPGQIITFIDPKDPQGLLTHRVAASRQPEQELFFLLTRGDRMLVFDRPLKVEELVGLVAWRVRNGRKLHIDQGSGAWLSRQLAKISEFERRWISGVSFADIAQTPVGISAVNNRVRERRDSRSARIVRAIGRSFSRFLAAGVLLFARQETVGHSN